MIYETQERLDEALAVWQKRLRLQDWEVSARIVDRSKIDNHRGAEIYVHWPKKSAYINLIHPDHYKQWRSIEEEKQDHERDLVHELLHIHIEPLWPEDSVKQDLAEQAIESLASAFIAAYRS